MQLCFERCGRRAEKAKIQLRWRQQYFVRCRLWECLKRKYFKISFRFISTQNYFVLVWFRF